MKRSAIGDRFPSSPDVEARAAAYVAKCAPAIDGEGGHITTLLVVEHLVRGFELDDGTALRVLGPWNARCAPPWSERELRHKLRQARERGTAVRWGQHLDGGRA